MLSSSFPLLFSVCNVTSLIRLGLTQSGSSDMMLQLEYTCMYKGKDPIVVMVEKESTNNFSTHHLYACLKTLD